MNPDSSRASAGARPSAAVNICVPTWVRIRARTSGGIGASQRAPKLALCAAKRLATCTRKGGAWS